MGAEDSVLHRTSVVDVRKVWVPVTLLGALFMAVVSGTLVYARLIDHVQSQTVHLDPNRVTEGGGLAYKNDVASLRNDLKWSLIEEQRRMRRLLRGATITCIRHSTQGGCSSWRIDLPEDSD